MSDANALIEWIKHISEKVEENRAALYKDMTEQDDKITDKCDAVEDEIKAAKIRIRDMKKQVDTHIFDYHPANEVRWGFRTWAMKNQGKAFWLVFLLALLVVAAFGVEPIIQTAVKRVIGR